MKNRDRNASRTSALRQHEASKVDAREGIPPVRNGSTDWGEMREWTPRITRRARRGTQKRKAEKSRLKYTPPPWRGGPEDR